MTTRGRIGLALGGGGARGLAHLGVIKVLEEAQIPVDCVAGTSIGALIGAIYALEPNSQALSRRCMHFLRSPAYQKAPFRYLISRNKSESDRFWAQAASVIKQRFLVNYAQSRISVIGVKRVKSFFKFFLAGHSFENLQLPFIASSVDLNAGEEVFHVTGELVPAVMASCAIPGFMPPVALHGKLLVDGMVLNPVPVNPARFLGADLVIAVDVGKDFPKAPVIENVVDVFMRTQQITAARQNQIQLAEADLAIHPNVSSFHWAEFDAYEEIIAAGELAARQVLPVLLELVRSSRRTKKNDSMNSFPKNSNRFGHHISVV